MEITESIIQDRMTFRGLTRNFKVFLKKGKNKRSNSWTEERMESFGKQEEKRAAKIEMNKYCYFTLSLDG